MYFYSYSALFKKSGFFSKWLTLPALIGLAWEIVIAYKQQLNYPIVPFYSLFIVIWGDHAEEPVPGKVDDAHGLIFKRVNQTGTVDELGTPGCDRFEELRHVLRRHREIGVEDKQDIP